jgi:hypothetical protein
LRKFELNKFSIAGRAANKFEQLKPFSRFQRKIRSLVNDHVPYHRRTYLAQSGVDFDSRLIHSKITQSIYLDGLWQSEGYFDDIADIVQKDFELKVPLDAFNQNLINEIRSKNSISVHVRFFDSGVGSHTYNTSMDYYNVAIRKVFSELNNPFFYIFSDNPLLAQKLLNMGNQISKVVSHNVGPNSFKDMILMSACRHSIIANSTFSWWGAWLGERLNQNRLIIAPGVISKTGLCGWGFKGLIPNRWTTL